MHQLAKPDLYKLILEVKPPWGQVTTATGRGGEGREGVGKEGKCLVVLGWSGRKECLASEAAHHFHEQTCIFWASSIKPDASPNLHACYQKSLKSWHKMLLQIFMHCYQKSLRSWHNIQLKCHTVGNCRHNWLMVVIESARMPPKKLPCMLPKSLESAKVYSWKFWVLPTIIMAIPWTHQKALTVMLIAHLNKNLKDNGSELQYPLKPA